MFGARLFPAGKGAKNALRRGKGHSLALERTHRTQTFPGSIPHTPESSAGLPAAIASDISPGEWVVVGGNIGFILSFYR